MIQVADQLIRHIGDAGDHLASAATGLVQFVTNVTVIIQMAARCFKQRGPSLLKRDIASQHQLCSKKIGSGLLLFHIIGTLSTCC